jgi:hypothetical protein
LGVHPCFRNATRAKQGCCRDWQGHTVFVSIYTQSAVDLASEHPGGSTLKSAESAFDNFRRDLLRFSINLSNPSKAHPVSTLSLRFAMADLTEKVEALERRLDKLSNVFDHIQKSLSTENPKRRHSVRTKTLGGRPEWVEEIVQHFNEISSELKSVKKTLDTRSFTDSSSSPSDGSAMNAEVAPQAELQHEALSQHQCTEQAPPAIPENGQRESVAANAPEPVGRPSPTSPPGQNIITKECPPQAHRVPVGCEVSLTPLTSTEPLNRTTQLNDALLDPQSEEGNAPIFHYNCKDIRGNLNEAKLVQFSSNPRVRRKGYFKLAVEGLPPLNMEEGSFNQPGKGYYTNFSCQPDSRGCVKVTKEQNQEIKFPGFPFPESQGESWSQ